MNPEKLECLREEYDNRSLEFLVKRYTDITNTLHLLYDMGFPGSTNLIRDISEDHGYIFDLLEDRQRERLKKSK